MPTPGAEANEGTVLVALMWDFPAEQDFSLRLSLLQWKRIPVLSPVKTPNQSTQEVTDIYMFFSTLGRLTSCVRFNR